MSTHKGVGSLSTHKGVGSLCWTLGLVCAFCWALCCCVTPIACGAAVDVGTPRIFASSLGGKGVAVAWGTASKKGLLLGKSLPPHWECLSLDDSSLAGGKRKKFLMKFIPRHTVVRSQLSEVHIVCQKQMGRES